jgi:transposase-like protein
MRRRFSAKQKAQIVLEILKEERTIAQIASEYSVHPNQLHRWKKQALDGFAEIFQKDDKQERTKEAAHERQLEELYAEIGRLTTQVNWLKKKSGLDVFEK